MARWFTTDLGDMIYAWIIGLDLGKEGSAIYDEAYAPNTEAVLANFKGFKISLRAH